MERLLEELKLHQTELEIQNDDLRVANEKLEQQQLKFSGVYDLAPVGFYVLDQDSEQQNSLGGSGLLSIKNRLGFYNITITPSTT